MCSHQRWVGQGVPGSPHGGTFEAVAVKMVVRNDDAERELDILGQVQQALQGQAGPHHIIQLLESMQAVCNSVHILVFICK